VERNCVDTSYLGVSSKGFGCHVVASFDRTSFFEFFSHACTVVLSCDMDGVCSEEARAGAWNLLDSCCAFVRTNVT
jgi:hypothetical protein